jgi:predicted DNA-binding transcriptional regulator AlpA
MKLSATTEPNKAFNDIAMTPAQVAKYTGLSVRTLANKRSNGSGPPFCKLGKILYWKSDVDRWVDAHRAQSCTQARAQQAITATRKRDELKPREGLGELTRVADAPFSEMKAVLTCLHPTEANWALQNLLRCESIVRQQIKTNRKLLEVNR